MLRYQYSTECDVNTLWKLYIDPNYATYFRHYPPFLNQPQFRSIQTKYGSLMAIYEATTKVGWVNINRQLNTGISDVSIILFNHKQKQGYGLEIMQDIAKYLFDGDTKKIVCLTVEDDTRTNDILKQGGFTKECVIPESCKYNDKYHNEIRWSLKKENYNA